jgi:hypothetical protein
MWYGKVMAARRNPQLNWDRLLDGDTYTLSLNDVGWERGLNDLRAKVHYEADRRRGIAHTHKIDAWTLEIWSEQCRVKTVPSPCTCGTKPWEGHVITCAKIRRPDLRQAARPAPTADHFAPGPGQDTASLAPADNTPTTYDQADEPTADRYAPDLAPADAFADDEALLGPCTCGQSPRCLPNCARVGG